MNKYSIVLLLSLGLSGIASNSAALTINFDYRYDTRGFFTDAVSGAPIVERRAMLETAAGFYRDFSDQLTAIAPGSGDQWSVTITHPSLAGAPVTLSNQQIEADSLTIFVGGSASAPGVLGFAGVGSNLTASGSDAFVDSVYTRGQENVSGSAASDFATWGGYIWFNASNDWYFGADSAGLTGSQPDFLTTATHEIGHILGFGEADSWFAQTDPLSGEFVGTQSSLVHGGSVPLDPYASHWAEGTTSLYQGMPQEAMMDPSTPYGQRQLPTDLDMAGFADIGWQVTPVPVPAAFWLMLTATGTLAFRRRQA